MSEHSSLRFPKFPLAFALFCALLYGTPALAGSILYTNGPVTGNTFHCDANASNCGSTGWTVLDDFTLSSPTTVTGFSFADFLEQGSLSDYVSTNWTLYSGNNPFTGSPSASGTAVFSLSADTFLGAEDFSLSGLNIGLSSGTFVLGFQNNFSSAADLTLRASSAGSDEVYYQYDNTMAFQNTLTGDTAFTVYGNSTTTAPEPSALLLLGISLFGLFAAASLGPFIRRRVRV